MGIDVLVLNTAVVDLRRPEFAFADALVGKGGLAKCETKDMPGFSQEQIQEFISQGSATAGGPGNAAPLMARAGLQVAVGVNLGAGQYGGLDAQGNFFYNTMRRNRVDMSSTFVHPSLPTGITFIHQVAGDERGGIAYFPNANNDFAFEHFKPYVKRLQPSIVYYMYSGLSDKGDAHNGKDLADFARWCGEKGIIVIADSHTLTGNPEEVISSKKPVVEYKLLEPLLPELDIFFTSSDEARMIENTLHLPASQVPKCPGESSAQEVGVNEHFLMNMAGSQYVSDSNVQTRLLGVTVKDGAYFITSSIDSGVNGGVVSGGVVSGGVVSGGVVSGGIDAKGLVHGQLSGQLSGQLPRQSIARPEKVDSRFMVGEVTDLVGAGDAFRAGLLTYIANNIGQYRQGNMNFREAVQMGNLFAALFIKAPLDDRYGNIQQFSRMLEIVKNGRTYETVAQLKADLGTR